MNWYSLIECCLITFGLSFSFAVTEGPGAAFSRVRRFVQNKWGMTSWQGQGIECPICCSFYAGILTAYLLGVGFSGWLCAVGFVNVVMALSPPDPE